MAWSGSEDSDPVSDSELDVLGVLDACVLDSPETEGAWTSLLTSLMMVDSPELDVAWLLLFCSLIVVKEELGYELGVVAVVDI